MNRFRRARALAAKQEHVTPGKSESVMSGPGMARQQNDPGIFRAHIVAERREAGVAADLHVVQIIKSRAPQRPVGHVEACRRDDTDGDIEAGRKPQYGPGILRYVRLVKREPQGFCSMC